MSDADDKIALEVGAVEVEVGKVEEHFCVDDAVLRRTQMFQALMKAIRELDPCPECASGAALYVAAVGAIYGMENVDRTEFMETAGRIFDDVILQKLGRRGGQS